MKSFVISYNGIDSKSLFDTYETITGTSGISALAARFNLNFRKVSWEEARHADIILFPGTYSEQENVFHCSKHARKTGYRIEEKP